MIIEESDFKIVYDDQVYTLYIINNTKEIKKDNKWKIAGYYIAIEKALQAVVIFRNSKKYSGNENSINLLTEIKYLLKLKLNFNQIINSIYEPIYKAKQTLILYK